MKSTLIANAIKRSIRRKINVLLENDVPSMGAKGSIISVTPGYMRNYLYPSSIASYLDWNLMVNKDPPSGYDKQLKQFVKPVINSSIMQSNEKLNIDILKQLQLNLIESLKSINVIELSRKTTTINDQNSNLPIHGSITSQDIVQHLQNAYSINLMDYKAHLEIDGDVEASTKGRDARKCSLHC